MDKKNIEAILPLTKLQNMMLQHHLHSPENDAGFLQVSVEIHGELNISVWHNAWDAAINQHPALRTSIHWKDLKNAVQVIHKTISFQIEKLSQGDDLNTYLQNDRARQINLSNTPTIRVTLLPTRSLVHHMIWSCHHIILDGWSSSLVLQEVLANYHALTENGHHAKRPRLELQDYQNWLKKQPPTESAYFWENLISKESNDFSSNLKPSKPDQAKIKKLVFPLASNVLINNKQYTHELEITFHNLLIGSWGLILSHYKRTQSLSCGFSVSGRMAPIDHLDSAIGMFANVLPLIQRINEEDSLNDFLLALFRKQNSLHEQEHCSLIDIQKWAGISPQESLFDNLVIYANQPWEERTASEGTQLSYKNLQGDFTSIYPLTLIVKETPIPSIEIYVDETRYSSEVADALGTLLVKLLTEIPGNGNDSIQNLKDTLGFEILPDRSSIETVETSIDQQVDVAENITHPQQDMLKLWKHIIKDQTINIDDNFFDIGGDSAWALELTETIRTTLPYVVSVDDLYRAPTVRTLVDRLRIKRGQDTTIDVVPIREESSGTPLFFITGFADGLIHYLELKQKIKKGRPLIGLGLSKNQKELKPDEILQHYFEELKRLQPQGPYHMVGYCEGSRIAFEITALLEKNGDTVGNLFIIDSQNISQPISSNGSKFTYLINGIKTLYYFHQTHRRFNQRLSITTVKEWLGSRWSNRGTAPTAIEDALNAQTVSKQEASFAKLFYRETSPHKQPLHIITISPRVSLSKRLDYTMGWGRYSHGPISIHNVPAKDHDAITKEPATTLVAEIINTALESDDR